MPIGSLPPNTTKATAQVVTLDPATHLWEATYPTSWYPSGDTFIPPGQAGYVAPVAFDMWFKYKPPSLVEANYYSTIGCTVWNIGDKLDYDPDETEGSKVTVSDFNELAPITGMRVQYYTSIIKDGWYYFKVVTPAPASVPITYMHILINLFEHTASLAGAVVVQDHRYDGAVVILNKTIDGDVNPYTKVQHIYTAETGHSIGGQAGEVLPMSGVTCIQDNTIGGVSLRNNLYTDIVSFVIGNPVQIRRDSHESRFWISYSDPNTFVGFIRSITVGPGGIGSAALGPVFSPTKVDATNKARALGVFNNQILYYTVYENIPDGIPEGTIRRWNLTTNSAMPDFYTQSTNPATYLGRVTDILVQPNGDVIVGFLAETTMGSFQSQYQYRVRKFNSAGTIIASAIDYIPGVAHGSIAFGELPEFFYVWRHADVLISNGNVSTFNKYRVSDLVEVQKTNAHEFYNQAILNEHSLYSGFFGENPQPPVILWGTDRGFIQSPFDGSSTYANFWINPFIIPKPSIPPVTPPVDPPPVNPNVGGGLITLDSTNTVKHDVYLDQLGNPLSLPIKITVRTAFLGD